MLAGFLAPKAGIGELLPAHIVKTAAITGIGKTF
jgi:hypothetical protein